MTRTKELLEALKEIPDYRVDIGKIEYPLHEVLFITLFALLSDKEVTSQSSPSPKNRTCDFHLIRCKY